MTTAGLTISAAALGVTGVAALYALHRLRAQPAHRAAATLLFWQHAAGPQNTRVLARRRFTHRKTFALLATTLLLLCAALTTDRWGGTNDGRQDVMVVDVGSETTASDAGGVPVLRRLTEAARADLLRSSGGITVLASAASPLPLAGPETPAALAARRLDALTPGPGASAARQALLAAGGIVGGPSGRIHWYTTRARPPAGLPDEIAARVVVHSVPAAGGIVITGVTAEPSADNAARCTLRVRLASVGAIGGTSVTCDVNGSAPVRQSVTTAGRTADVVFQDQPADGRRVRIGLTNAAGPGADGRADFRLPDWRPLTFRFAAGVPTALRLALLTAGTEAGDGAVYVGPADAVVPADARAAVLVCDGPGNVPAGRPLVSGDASVVRGLDLEGAVAAAGTAVPARGLPLVTAGGVTVVGLDAANAVPTLFLSNAVVGPSAELPRRAAFPVLLNRVCDVLARRGPPGVNVAASRLAEDPLWSGPADAPGVTTAPVADRPDAAVAPHDAGAAVVGRRAWDWTVAVLAAGLLLLAVDASLRLAGKAV